VLNWLRREARRGVRMGGLCTAGYTLARAGLLDGKRVLINPSLHWGKNPRVQAEDYKILGMPLNGTFAEQVVVPKEQIHALPEHLSFEEGAALPLAGLTAYRALFTKCQLQAGEKVLISGIGGGVALTAMQLALAAGASVYVTSGSEEKIEKAIELGASGGANYRSENWHKDLNARAGEFDVVIDSAGGDGFEELLKLCKPGGRLAIYGGTRGKITKVTPQLIFWRQISIHGTTMGTNEEFKALLELVNRTKLVPHVETILPMEKGHEGFEMMAESSQFGKIVLQV